MTHGSPTRQAPPFYSTFLAFGNKKTPTSRMFRQPYKEAMLTSSSGKQSYGTVWAEPEVSMEETRSNIGRRNKETEWPCLPLRGSWKPVHSVSLFLPASPQPYVRLFPRHALKMGIQQGICVGKDGHLKEESPDMGGGLKYSLTNQLEHTQECQGPLCNASTFPLLLTHSDGSGKP